MRQIIIQIDDDKIQVIEDGRTSGQLAFDEMLGQIVSMIPKHLQCRGEGPRYQMFTPEEWAERDARIFRNSKESRHGQHP